MKFALLVLLFVTYCAAQLTQTDKDNIVLLHNNARDNANPVPQTPLAHITWNEDIAKETQSWVSQCKKNYSPKYYATLYGENPLIMTPSLDIESAFSLWLKQSESYNFNDATCAKSSCANYQQIVSTKTTEIGCAVATCSFGAFFVCNYKTFSQYSGELPYTPSTVPKPTTKPISPPTLTSTSTSTTGSSGYASIDYRGSRAVLGMHDQKQCGSCWAFATVAIIEGVCGLKGMTVPMLSDQDVLDCSKGGSCSGGWTPTALAGMVKQGGINSQDAYPYQEKQGTCAHVAAASQGKITKSGQTIGTFDAMYNALVTYGPVGIAVFVDDSWYSYDTGVIKGDYDTINHAVTVVGYDSSLDAWIVKNSWGSTWGMSGFFYLDAKHPAAANVHGAFWAQ